MQKENLFTKIVNNGKNFFNNLAGRGEEHYDEDEDMEIDYSEDMGYEDDEIETEDKTIEESVSYRQEPKISSFRSNKAPYEIQIVKPRDEMAATTIIALLKKRNAVVVNMEYLDKETAKNILHYISGGAFALDGKIKKVSNAIFMVVPTGIELSLYERGTRESYDFGMKPWEKVN